MSQVFLPSNSEEIHHEKDPLYRRTDNVCAETGTRVEEGCRKMSIDESTEEEIYRSGCDRTAATGRGESEAEERGGLNKESCSRYLSTSSEACSEAPGVAVTAGGISYQCPPVLLMLSRTVYH